MALPAAGLCYHWAGLGPPSPIMIQHAGIDFVARKRHAGLQPAPTALHSKAANILTMRQLGIGGSVPDVGLISRRASAPTESSFHETPAAGALQASRRNSDCSAVLRRTSIEHVARRRSSPAQSPSPQSSPRNEITHAASVKTAADIMVVRSRSKSQGKRVRSASPTDFQDQHSLQRQTSKVTRRASQPAKRCGSRSPGRPHYYAEVIAPLDSIANRAMHFGKDFIDTSSDDASTHAPSPSTSLPSPPVNCQRLSQISLLSRSSLMSGRTASLTNMRGVPDESFNNTFELPSSNRSYGSLDIDHSDSSKGSSPDSNPTREEGRILGESLAKMFSSRMHEVVRNSE